MLYIDTDLLRDDVVSKSKKVKDYLDDVYDILSNLSIPSDFTGKATCSSVKSEVNSLSESLLDFKNYVIEKCDSFETTETENIEISNSLTNIISIIDSVATKLFSNSATENTESDASNLVEDNVNDYESEDAEEIDNFDISTILDTWSWLIETAETTETVEDTELTEESNFWNWLTGASETVEDADLEVETSLWDWIAGAIETVGDIDLEVETDEENWDTGATESAQDVELTLETDDEINFDAIETIMGLWNVSMYLGVRGIASLDSVVFKFVVGFGKLVGALIDFLVIAVTAVGTIITGLIDLISCIWGDTDFSWSKTLWKDTMSFVATPYVDNWVNSLYENDVYFQALDELSYSPFKSDGIVTGVAEGLGEVAGIVALTVATLGIGTAVSGASTAAAATTGAVSATTGAATVAGTTVATGAATTATASTAVATTTISSQTVAATSAIYAGLSGFGKTTGSNWNEAREKSEDGEDWQTLGTWASGIFEGIIVGAWEGIQYYVGSEAVTGATGALGQKITNKAMLSVTRVGIDTLFNTLDTPFKAFADMITSTEETTFEESFEELGGWSSVLVSAGVGLIGSIGGELWDHYSSSKINKTNISSDADASDVININVSSDVNTNDVTNVNVSSDVTNVNTFSDVNTDNVTNINIYSDVNTNDVTNNFVARWYMLNNTEKSMLIEDAINGNYISKVELEVTSLYTFTSDELLNITNNWDKICIKGYSIDDLINVSNNLSTTSIRVNPLNYTETSNFIQDAINGKYSDKVEIIVDRLDDLTLDDITKISLNQDKIVIKGYNFYELGDFLYNNLWKTNSVNSIEIQTKINNVSSIAKNKLYKYGITEQQIDNALSSIRVISSNDWDDVLNVYDCPSTWIGFANSGRGYIYIPETTSIEDIYHEMNHLLGSVKSSTNSSTSSRGINEAFTEKIALLACGNYGNGESGYWVNVKSLTEILNLIDNGEETMMQSYYGRNSSVFKNVLNSIMVDNNFYDELAKNMDIADGGRLNEYSKDAIKEANKKIDKLISELYKKVGK